MNGSAEIAEWYSVTTTFIFVFDNFALVKQIADFTKSIVPTEAEMT